ncbi:unnamed protein product [Ceratitis capitata]|uniref:(Mediterranean fruit fly) hypothetical protein n=1 Tax=Ceratitis capitata TaxID=7213 RepID=A0A811V4M0_CERCA|nr:unnamed protein product [Ceratitis capitata]
MSCAVLKTASKNVCRRRSAYSSDVKSLRNKKKKQMQCKLNSYYCEPCKNQNRENKVNPTATAEQMVAQCSSGGKVMLVGSSEMLVLAGTNWRYRRQPQPYLL